MNAYDIACILYFLTQTTRFNQMPRGWARLCRLKASRHLMRRLRHLGLEGYRSGMLNFIRQWLKVSLFKKKQRNHSFSLCSRFQSCIFRALGFIRMNSRSCIRSMKYHTATKRSDGPRHNALARMNCWRSWSCCLNRHAWKIHHLTHNRSTTSCLFGSILKGFLSTFQCMHG